jgi:cytochrome b6-f complex iron-sulfur subunit
MDRRTALKNLFAFIPLGAAFTGLTAMGIRFITPNRKDVCRLIFTVSLDELPVNASRQFQDLQGRDLVIVRTGENGVKALSTVCTHLGCTVYWQKDKKLFYCPCHQDQFDENGNVLSGPPPRPLDSYRVEIDDRNVFIYFKDKEV